MKVFQLHNGLFLLGLAIVVAVMLGGCGGGGTDSTPANSFAGRWTMTARAHEGNWQMKSSLTIAPNGEVTGTVVDDGATGTDSMNGTPITGSVKGGDYTASLDLSIGKMSWVGELSMVKDGVDASGGAIDHGDTSAIYDITLSRQP